SELLAACQTSGPVEPTLTWVDEQFLSEQEVSPWSDLPLWITSSDASYAHFLATDCRKAIASGLQFRTVAETVRDTLAWASTRPADYQWKAGITREREQALLDAWHHRDEI